MHSLFFAMGGNPQAGQGGSGSWWVSFLPIIMIFAIFYLLLILPQQKKQKQHMNMINALRKGDRILTNGGIYGTVFDVKEHDIVIKISDEVKVELVKNAIAAVVEKKGE